MIDVTDSPKPHRYPTHDDPPEGVARTLLGAVEGDRLCVGLAAAERLAGPIQTAEREPPGEMFDTAGHYQLRFEAAGVTFQLLMTYRESGGIPTAESLDLRLVEGREWSIPITVGICGISKS